MFRSLRARSLAPVLGAAAVASVLLVAPARAANTGIPTVRYAGADRFDTAADVSRHTFADDCGCVAYVANAYNFPDALAGAAAAGSVHGPILLVGPTGAPDQATTTELARLRPTKIVVLGDATVVAAETFETLRQYAPAIVRYAGPDRFATAADISSHTFPASCGCVAYIGNAYSFPDALAGAAAAGKVHGPVLLANATGTLDPATAAELGRLRPTKIIILGGTSAISDSVATALRTYTTNVVRYAGADRYATAATISARTFPADCGCVAYLANAKNFPDALAGAAAAGQIPGPVLLVDPIGEPSPAVVDEIARLQPTKVIVLGGTDVVSDQVASAAAGPFAGSPAPATWSRNMYSSSLVRYQDPDRSACTAAVVLMMLNFISTTSTRGATFTWAPTITYTSQENVLEFERLHMTMLTTSKGADPHGARNALNYYGWYDWQTAATFHYADLAFATYDDAVHAIVRAIARYNRPVAILSWAGRHMQFIHGYSAYGQDPSQSDEFDVVTLYLTDPLAADGLRNTPISYANFLSGSTIYRFQPYLETDSPYDDPLTPGTVAAKSEWYGKYVIVAPIR